MTTNAPYSSLWRVESPVRRLHTSSILAWSGSALAAFVGFSGAVAQSWAVPLAAFCGGMGIAFACRIVTDARSRSRTRRSAAMAPASRPLLRDRFTGGGIWQEIDRNRDLLHLLKEKTRPHADTALLPITPLPDPQFTAVIGTISE